ncbi:zinc ABC transporter ATP-binding protein AztA [Pseudonocardia sp. TRM90224]|uniref:zinc ABC transporter ATP-binding protein AztA n=1 Tax=Pseudonocardia sp. TRM90224 TaxID=2812678 RepID=UPI001E2DEB54|nr:zinc ABC transporter ATP-binding protein AztA [Pseudonocardia sp. TRM90224]
MVDTPDAVVIHELTAGYARHLALCGVSARIPASRITAVVGANGAGKSTLLDVIAGVRPLISGRVDRTGSGRPAYVAQRSDAPAALPITVRNVVAMGRWAHRGPWRRLTACDRAVVDDRMAQLGIQHLARAQLGALSGGQRQRVLVAQGLAQDADLLLLDEPAAGLDLQARRSIDDALRTAGARGVTVLRVTHDLGVAEHADHCLLLHRGTVLAEGAPAEVLTPERVAEAWGVPAGQRTATRPLASGMPDLRKK